MHFLSKNKLNKSFLIIAGILPAMVLTLSPTPAHAQWYTKALSWLAGGVSSIAAWTIYALFYAVWMIVGFILTFVSFLLNHLFYYNVIMNPMNMPFVVQGWGVTRDIANSFFILIVLWIALTIIFNIEHLGGKQLLMRLIIVALLINFSLAITGAVFGFANAIALPLRDKIPQDIGGFIMKQLNLHTIAEPPTPANTGAVGNTTATDCGLAAIIGAGAGGGPCLQANIAQSISKDASESSTETAAPPASIMQKTMNMGISILLVLIVIAAFIIASANLFMRIIAMAMLGVLAPLAFLAFIIPGGKLKSVWDQWLSKLFSWAFYAPAFYFLFYLSLLVLNAMAGSGSLAGSTAPIEGNLMRMLPLVLFVGFMMASITIGKKMGITTGEAALGIATTAGVAALTGGASLAGKGASAIMRRPAVKEKVESAMDTISRVPVLRMAMRPAMKKTMEHYEQDQKDVLKGAEQYKNFKATDKLNLFRSTPNLTTKKAAELAHAIGTDKDAMKLITNDAEKQRILQLTSQFSLQSKVLETNPHLIKDDDAARRYTGKATRKEAIEDVVKNASDKSAMSKEAVTDPIAGKEVTAAVIKSIKNNGDLNKIGRDNPELTNAMIDMFNTAAAAEIGEIKQALGRAKVESLKRYMNTSPGARHVWGNQLRRNSHWDNIDPTYG